MRLTQFSIFLSVLATQSSKLLNINGQHGCSNTELYLCSSISTAQSEISSVAYCSKLTSSPWEKYKHLSFISTAKCSSHSAHLSTVKYYETFSLFTAGTTHWKLVRMQIHLIQLQCTPKFLWNSVCFLVGHDVCLTHSNFSWHTLNASNGTLREGRNTLMN